MEIFQISIHIIFKLLNGHKCDLITRPLAVLFIRRTSYFYFYLFDLNPIACFYSKFVNLWTNLGIQKIRKNIYLLLLYKIINWIIQWRTIKRIFKLCWELATLANRPASRHFSLFFLFFFSLLAIRVSVLTLSHLVTFLIISFRNFCLVTRKNFTQLWKRDVINK